MSEDYPMMKGRHAELNSRSYQPADFTAATLALGLCRLVRSYPPAQLFFVNLHPLASGLFCARCAISSSISPLAAVCLLTPVRDTGFGVKMPSVEQQP